MAEIENKYGSIVTDVGVQLITEAVMEGQKVNITTLAVGDGGGSYYKPNSTMTALKGEKWRGKVNRVEVNEKSPNMIDVVAVVPSDVGGWTIREMGVFGRRGRAEHDRRLQYAGHGKGHYHQRSRRGN